MHKFVSYVLRGRTQAITVAAACAALSLLLPPVSYVSGAVIGLATLRNGAHEGGLVIAGSVLLAGALTWLLVGSVYPIMVFAVLTWIPVWLLAQVLRVTANQGSVLLVAGALGALALGVVHLVVADPAAWWEALLQRFVDDAVEGAPALASGAGKEQLAELIHVLAPIMTGLVAAATVLGLILALFLARWWHALVDNPGGFGREFRSLAIDPRFAPVALVIMLLAVLANAMTGGLAGESALIVVVLYMLQGLAVVHSVVNTRGASLGWLVGLYVLLVLLPPQVILLLALTGFIDVWMKFRARAGS
ncbi:MAG: hypothetical protein ACFCVA_03100 [Gammaproteobacteria bacterium]